jgi:hypothetical protein
MAAPTTGVWQIGTSGPLYLNTGNAPVIVFPNAVVGVPYNQDYHYLNDPTVWLDAQACAASPNPTPCSWVGSGPNPFINNWVSGLSNDSTFNISGTPTAPGVYTFNAAFFDNLAPLNAPVWQVFQLTVVAPTPFPNPADLRFFDNANVVPAPQGVTAPFNDEPANVWLGWDGANCRLCITNYNRLIIICCFDPQI